MTSTEPTKRQFHRVPPYRRPLIVGGFLLLVSIVGIVTVLICKSFAKSEDSSTPTPQSSISSSDNNSHPSTPTRGPDSEDLENKTPQYEGENPNDLDELTGEIIYDDIDEEEQILHVAVMVNQYLTDNGQCILNLRRDDTIFRTSSALITPDVTSSGCGPFKVSIEDLPSGAYQLEIIMTGDGKRGVITKELEI